MFSASNIQYEVAGRVSAVGCGGIGAIHLLARSVGLVDAIDEHLHLLKVHLPYHESDHVLNIAYNIAAGGDCLEDLELLRNDEAYLDALGAQRIPDPTTEGDFCRRFKSADVESLMNAINQVRLDVWKQQPPEFFEHAVIDADGTPAQTYGECKEGMDINYKGDWGYHPLLISLANTAEPLFLVNRSGNRPSHEGAAERFDQAAELCRRAGFKRITFRGDTDFTQTAHLDRWDGQGIRFIFGIDAMPSLVQKANDLPASAWEKLDRPAKYAVKTEERARPQNVKERIVKERGFENIRLEEEHVAEFEHRPTKCQKAYRVVVVRKKLAVEKGQERMWTEYRYYFYITNDRPQKQAKIVFEANGRCNQENLIEQLKNGVSAMRMPVDDLVSNWAYMVMASLAWTLKAWAALMLPVSPGRWSQKHKEQKAGLLKMEFKRFVNMIVRVPAQIVKTGRRLIYRLLGWNGWQMAFLRAAEAWRQPLGC